MSRRELVSWIGLALLGAGVLIGATNAAVLFPHWDLDPFVSPVPVIGVTPVWRAVLDVTLLVGAGLAVLGAERARGWMVGLWALGAGVCGAHGIGDPEAARLGLTWSAALAAGIGCAHLAGDPTKRRVLAAVLVGVVALLAAKGAGQVFIEHPATVRSFEADRESLLAARGWEDGSVSARLFERRLRQPEATGWFGLANVYASFAAATLVGFAGAAWLLLRQKVKLMALASAGVALLGAGLLVLAGSKGGWGAAVLGAGFVAALCALPRRVAVTAAIGAVALALLAVVARGLAPIAPESELSLLFRWYYLQGATRVIGERPLVGVSPTGFRDAYLLVKPALSPEQVSSPHSVLFDWVAALGLGGLGWCGLLVAWVGGAGRARAGADNAPWSTPGRDEMLGVVAAAVVVGAVGAFIESAAATPEGAVFRLLGIAGWVGVGLLVLRLPARVCGVLLAGAAVTLAVHAQIEMTGIWVNAAGLWAALIGLGCAPGCSALQGRSRGWAGPGGAGLLWLGAAVLGGVALPSTLAWERALGDAAREAAISARIDGAFREASLSPSAADAGAVLRRAAIEVGAGTGSTTDQTAARLAAAQRGSTRLAVEGLERAVSADPGHHETRVALGRGLFRLAELDAPARDELLRQALDVALAGTVRRADSARAWAWAGRAVVLAGERGQGEMGAALELWERAAALDPGGLVHAVRLMDLSERLGDREEAARWAARVLDLDAQHRLDPLSGLNESERRRAERLGGSGG